MLRRITMERKFNEEELYDKLIELKKGTTKERKLAFKCLGILSHETTTESYENRLKMVNDMINENNKK
jgi:hypothetical protein